jgi:transcriptional/translational regulatory protein YebC/TACO1
LSSPGAVAYLFTRAGEIEINKNNKNNKNSNPINPINPINTVTFEEVFERAVEAGAEDVEDSGESFSVYTKPADLHAVQERLMATGLAIVNSGLVFRPNKETLIALSPEDAGRMEALLEALDEMDEVQEVYTNTQ